MPAIKHTELKTLKDFYALMAATRQVRYQAVGSLLAGETVPAGTIESLANALSALENIPEVAGKRVLSLDGDRTIDLDMDYEINEARKDIFYLEEGEETFLDFLDDLHPGFDDHVAAGRELLNGLDLNCMITDRDGTINNYCARYLTSIQSIYNSVFLSRFAMEKVQKPVILTSAPLGGLIEISVNPEGEIYYAASKGRECLDLEGRTRRLPISPEKQVAIDTLNARLSEMLASPEYEKFSLIGSGLQFKFGQSTVARQDIGKSIAEDESKAFLETLSSLVTELDPDEQNFRIEDTGLDVEIILTIETSGDGLKDFDKGDGVKYLNSELGLDMFHGPHLICGDTGSDVPMLEAALEIMPETRAIYVTENEDLAKRVMGLTPNALIVPEPDMLVTIMGTL
ncbi:trehalose 6-phosphate synthase [Pseudodesulfovibrio sp. zrk46]|uniref:trehalose 6-phosphate synthase n=1 Tax=Pseudodesulfovibrio sp. zrk46 TaxID=2725288 RepID=UPI0014491073|nr:trehalose 6-phosphate synthase [Pseudodesulfovibrio sp. zrk46]QJB56689.1 trehalose 6-phosphate synthase [Pseudodesulfovibrio sp. zrk46]